jgi:hypothetical protein
MEKKFQIFVCGSQPHFVRFIVSCPRSGFGSVLLQFFVCSEQFSVLSSFAFGVVWSPDPAQVPLGQVSVFAADIFYLGLGWVRARCPRSLIFSPEIFVSVVCSYSLSLFDPFAGALQQVCRQGLAPAARIAIRHRGLVFRNPFLLAARLLWFFVCACVSRKRFRSGPDPSFHFELQQTSLSFGA